MKVGYMTNAWGDVVGHCAGVGSVKDLYYLSTKPDEEAVKVIAETGFEYIEIFDGNLMEYAEDKKTFTDMMKKSNVKLFAVYTAANFIFDEILEEEFFKLEKVVKLAKELGAKHIVVGGGAIRSDGVKEEDYSKLAVALDKFDDMAKENGLVASYHPHLGTCVQAPDQLDKLMALTKIALCPDCAHVNAGGGDAVEVVRKYKDRIKYLHLKDYKDSAFLPLGLGEIDFKEILSILSSNVIPVDYTVEVDGYPGDSKEAAKVCYDYLKNII
jgi:inosose dehydratase